MIGLAASIYMSLQGWQANVFRQAVGLSSDHCSDLSSLNVVGLLSICSCKGGRFSVKKRSGDGTRPKALLQDMSLPPLGREIDTRTTMCFEEKLQKLYIYIYKCVSFFFVYVCFCIIFLQCTLDVYIYICVKYIISHIFQYIDYLLGLYIYILYFIVLY